MLMAEALLCCSTLQLENRWITEDSKIVALVTCIEKLQETAHIISLMSTSNSGIRPGGKKRIDKAWMFNIPPKNKLQEKIVDRKTYYVCKHKHNNRNGIRVRHKLEDCDFSKFQAKKGKKYKGSKANPPSKLKRCVESLIAHLSLL